MVDAFGGARPSIKPPERGIFPLDHFGECKLHMKDYLRCISQSKGDHFPCREKSRAYLQCRMDKELMAKEDLDNLGLGSFAEYVRIPSDETSKEKGGFIAGLNVKPSGKWF